MTVKRTLARVEEDLRAGDVVMARTRLRGLVGCMPQRLELRERLAQVYRLEGDRAQAGRWAYLGEQRDPRETAAFDRAYHHDAVRVMWALGWRGPEQDASTQTARERLLEVRARAEQDAGSPQDWANPRRPEQPEGWRRSLGEMGCLLAVIALVGSVIVGVVTIIRWIAQAVFS